MVSFKKEEEELLVQRLKQQVTYFFYAVSYFTRIPIPSFVKFDDKTFHKGNTYLPIIGAVVALILIACFYLSQLVFSLPISAILTITAGVLLTGGLHEDGFADCCDGLGGGFNKEQCLKIMKDSRIGSYGAIGLLLLLLLKFNLYMALAERGLALLFVALLTAHVLSRYAVLWLMQSLDYVRLGKEGKVESLATKLNTNLFIAASLFTLPFLLLTTIKTTLIVFISLVIGTFLLRLMMHKKLKGYTGDCLGFSQQCLELLILLLFSSPLIL